MNEIRHINYQSDFLLMLRFPEQRPAYPWCICFFTKDTQSFNYYRVEFDGEKYVNCEPAEGDTQSVLVVFDNHHLAPGILQYRLREDIPDAFFPDGERKTITPILLDNVELWHGPTDDMEDPPLVDVTISSLRAIKGDRGADGHSPILSVAMFEDRLYWQIDGQWLLQNGAKIPATGNTGEAGKDGQHGKDGAPGADGHSPILSVAMFEDRLYWQIDGQWLLQNGAKIPATGNTGEAGKDGKDGAPGADGHSPILGVAEFEGRLCWQVDGQWLLLAGQKIPTNGETGEPGHTPYIGENGNWWIQGKDTGKPSLGTTPIIEYANNLGDRTDIAMSQAATSRELQLRVEKIDGKMLSTEDFTTLLRQKLETLSNYDDTVITAVVFSVQNQLDTLLNGDVDGVINAWNEIETFLAGITETQTLAGLLAELRTEIADLIPKKVSQLTNDASYATIQQVSEAIEQIGDGAAGKDGITPIVGVKQDTDGYSYWTVKIGDNQATWITDSQGNKVRTTGDKGDTGQHGEDGIDGHTPILSVAAFEGRLYWQIDGQWLWQNEAKVPAAGDAGTPGSIWYTGADISGTSLTPEVFIESGVADARMNDCYLNSSYGYVYQCVTPGVASVATWRYVLKIKGDSVDMTDIPVATPSSDGLMSAADKSKLDEGEKSYLLVITNKTIEPDAAQKVLDAYNANKEILVKFSNNYIYKPTNIQVEGDVIALFTTSFVKTGGNLYSILTITVGSIETEFYSKSIVNVSDRLDYYSTQFALSANQGRVLNESISRVDANKVDKVSGKDLSSNDFTDADKDKLGGIESGANNYAHPDDSYIRHVTDTEKTTWNNKVDKVSGKDLSSNDFTDADKVKLNGIAYGANNYTHPDNSSTRHVTDTEKATWNNKASSSVATPSSNGLMSSEDKTKLNGLSNYTHPDNSSTRHVTDTEKTAWNNKANSSVATTSSNGLMSYTDKVKLNGIASGANNYTHPDNSSTRHVTDTEKTAWNNKANKDLSNVTLSKAFGNDGGFYRAPDGLLIQWGYGTTNSDGISSLFYPVSFKVAPPFITVALDCEFSTPAMYLTFTSFVGGVSLTYFNVYARGVMAAGVSASVSNASIGFTWIAVGRWK